MTTTDASGTVRTVLASSTPIETMSLMAHVRPMALTSLPPGAYRSMPVTIVSGTVLYMDPASGQRLQKSVTGPMTATIQFSPNMTVGSTPGVVNIDMDMANQDLNVARARKMLSGTLGFAQSLFGVSAVAK